MFITLCQSYCENRAKEPTTASSKNPLPCKLTMKTIPNHLPSPGTHPLPPPPLHHSLQLPPQRISHLLLSRPLLTQPLHPTARHNRKSYRSQGRSFPTFFPNLRSETIGDAEARRRRDGVVRRFDAHFR